MEVYKKFRSALGGFNRRDVVSYIEAEESAHRKQIAELEKRLNERETAHQELEAAMAGLQTENGSVAAEEAKVRASLEESTQTLARVRGELSQAETQLAAHRRELTRLQAQVAQLEPMAKSYEELKDRIATVELDAHKKAQATLDEANAQAENTRQAARQWLTGLLGQYDRLTQAVDEMSESVRESSEAAQRLREWGGLE